MSNTRQNKRRILVTSPAPHKPTQTMGNVTTCFRSLELDEPRDTGHAAAPALSDNKFKELFQVTRSDDDDSDNSTASHDWDDEEDGGAWSSDDDDVIDSNSDDIWNSFSLPNIPYAHEYIEQQISLTNVKIANAKSEQIYDSCCIHQSNSLKKVQFRDEPDLVTVIH